MNQHLDLSQLRTLLVIGRTGSFSMAAAQLFKTQPAVSHQMQQLSAALGVPLFEKSGRGRQLTPHGVKLVHYARELLALNDEAFRVLDEDHKPGTLRVGAPHDLAETLLPSILKHVKQKFPLARVEAMVERVPKLMEALRLAELDLCVSPRPAPGYQAAVIRTSPCVWICAADFAFDRLQPVPLILAEGMSIYRDMAQLALERANLRWAVSYVASDLVGIKAAVRAGLGVTPRCIDMLAPDMRTVGADDGLPTLPSVSFYLLRKEQDASGLTRDAFESFRTQWKLPDAPPQ